MDRKLWFTVLGLSATMLRLTDSAMNHVIHKYTVHFIQATDARFLFWA